MASKRRKISTSKEEVIDQLEPLEPLDADMHPFEYKKNDELILGINQLPKDRLPDFFNETGGNFIFMFNVTDGNVTIIYQNHELSQKQLNDLIYSILFRLTFFDINISTPFLISVNYIHRSNETIGLHIDSFPIPDNPYKNDLQHILYGIIQVTKIGSIDASKARDIQQKNSNRIERGSPSNYTLLDFVNKSGASEQLCASTMYYLGKMESAQKQVNMHKGNRFILNSTPELNAVIAFNNRAGVHTTPFLCEGENRCVGNDVICKAKERNERYLVRLQMLLIDKEKYDRILGLGLITINLPHIIQAAIQDSRDYKEIVPPSVFTDFNALSGFSRGGVKKNKKRTRRVRRSVRRRRVKSSAKRSAKRSVKRSVRRLRKK